MTCNPRHRPIPAPPYPREPELARQLHERLRTRRTIRQFSPDPVDPEVIRLAVATAHTAPSGANRQPWRFVVVTDPDLKEQIRAGAEEEERQFYVTGDSGPGRKACGSTSCFRGIWVYV